MPQTIPHFDTFEEFNREYRRTFRMIWLYTPKQVGFDTYGERLADLADAFPEWAERAEALDDYETPEAQG